MINTKEDVLKIIKLFKICAAIMAVFYIGFLFLLLLKIIPFTVLYEFLRNPEFAFRGNTALFYKGFLYMCCGLFFFITGKSKNNYWGALIIIIAVVATFVRGFIVSLFACYFFYLAFIKNIVWGVVFAAAIFFSFPFIYGYYMNMLGNKSAGDQIRVTQYEQVLQRTTPFSIIIGNGYGVGVPVRANHFEINYLELFYKQGIVGLMFWFFLLALVVFKFYKARQNGNTRLATPFLLSCLFLYIQSASNPFLSNSMGMTMLFISILCLDILGKKNQVLYE